MTNIVFFGCSFTYGEDSAAPSRKTMSDIFPGYPWGTTATDWYDPELTYPAFVGKAFNGQHNIVNKGWPGYSNHAIYLSVVDYVFEDPDRDFSDFIFVVNFTQIYRSITATSPDKSDPCNFVRYQKYDEPLPFKSVMPGNKVYQDWCLNNPDEEYSYVSLGRAFEKTHILEVETSTIIRAIKEFLQSRNIKFMFVNMLMNTDINYKFKTVALKDILNDDHFIINGKTLWTDYVNEIKIPLVIWAKYGGIFTGHPNSVGYKFIADIVSYELKNRFKL